MDVQQADGVGIGQHIYEHNFVLIAPSMRIPGGLALANILKDLFLVLIIKRLRHLCGLELFGKQARSLEHISASGCKEMCRLCGILWLGWLRDVGRYEGLAPSMWAFCVVFGE